MADIQSATAEIRRGKKERKKEETSKWAGLDPLRVRVTSSGQQTLLMARLAWNTRLSCWSRVN